MSDSRARSQTYKLSPKGTLTLVELLDGWLSRTRDSSLRKLMQNNKNPVYSLTIQVTRRSLTDTEAELWISTTERPKSSD